jgi:hypothetical protein
MATTTVSIGSRTTTVDTETPASSSGGGPLYTVTFGTTPSGIAVGDMGFMDTQAAGGGSPSDYEFVVTAISGANITLKYLRDSDTQGDHSPLGLYTGAGSSGSPTQAAMVFKRHGIPTSSAGELDDDDVAIALSYVVTFSDAGPPADSVVGDIAFVTSAAASSDYEYLITAIDLSAKTVTMKYVQDSATAGDASPYGMVNSNTTQAVIEFRRAFSTIVFFEAMVDDSSPIYWGSSDDVVGECYGDADFTDATVSFTQKQSLASVKLTAADKEGNRHDGTASGTGGGKVLLRPTTSSGHSQGIFRVGIDSMTIEWIEIDMGALDSTNTNKAVVLTGTNDDFILRNMLIHDKGGDPGSAGPHLIHVIGAGASTDTLTIQNNIIYDIVETSNDSTIAINVNQWAGISNIYNNTIYKLTSAGSGKATAGIVCGSASSSVSNVKNNIVSLLASTAGGTQNRAYWKTGSGSTNIDTANNLSDDTTHATYNAEDMAQSLDDTSGLIGKTLAEISFVSTSPVDLHIDTDSDCIEAGVDLGTTNEVNIDIDGVDRDATGVTWDIGADQASVSDTGSPAFMMFLD